MEIWQVQIGEGKSDGDGGGGRVGYTFDIGTLLVERPRQLLSPNKTL